jgi:hypothetical protein
MALEVGKEVVEVIPREREKKREKVCVLGYRLMRRVDGRRKVEEREKKRSQGNCSTPEQYAQVNTQEAVEQGKM